MVENWAQTNIYGKLQSIARAKSIVWIIKNNLCCLVIKTN